MENNETGRTEDLKAQISRLQRELYFMAAAIDNLPTPLFMKDKDARFVFFNKCYADCFDIDKEKYIGKTVLDLDYLPEADRSKFQKEDMISIENGEECRYYKDFMFSDMKYHNTHYWSKGFMCPETNEKGLIGQIIDLSDEKKVKENLVEMVQGMANLFDHFFVVDLVDEKVSIIKKDNDTHKGMSIDTTLARFIKETKDRFINPVTKHDCSWFFTIEGMKQLLDKKDDFYFECRDRQKGETIYGTTMYCIGREDNSPVRVIYAARDVTETKRLEGEYRNRLKEANEKLKDIANHDGLTGLYNRRGLMEVINLRFSEDTKAAVLLCDVDRFKTVNDTYGHFKGDELLVKVAGLLRTSFRNDDILVRLGGDEFMAILVDCKYEDRAFIVRKIAAINEALQNDDSAPRGSLSVGVAFSRPGETQGLYERADKALYKVKENGRKNCCIYEEEFEEET